MASPPQPLRASDDDDDLDDHFHDQCGVFGVFGDEEAANLTYLGLHALQHRGQEAAGIATTDGERLYVQRGLGLVQDVFNASVMEQLPGAGGIGHVRYSTAGGTHVKNTQPIAVDYAHGSIAVAHNGNLTNYIALRRELEAQGSIFNSASDTEVFVHLIARSKAPTTEGRVADALHRVQGAYSLVFLSVDELIAVRDPWGFRPLCLGMKGDAWVVASEPPAFHLMGAEYVRDVEPGEMIVVDRFGMRSTRPFGEKPKRFCIFEHIYFARPDASFGGVSVYQARKRLGRTLAKLEPVDADLVIPVPDSGVAAALGFATETGLPYEMGLIRSHYVGRTFIEPQQQIRHFGVRLKLHPVRELLEGKRVAVVDDSIVRGTTSRKIVKMLREAGAAEVHLRISSPPTRWPCFYGIDTPTREELIASRHTPEEIARYVTADSLGYLSVEGLREAIGGDGFCDACFSGEYPVPVELPKKEAKRQLPLVGV
ncbi:MAG: amidophosphoribosyltransferase [Deltaproteobacteria bacterium]|nr:amidophosphoribosyltransferase [Deltaproteobacteria bacterium]